MMAPYLLRRAVVYKQEYIIIIYIIIITYSCYKPLSQMVGRKEWMIILRKGTP